MMILIFFLLWVGYKKKCGGARAFKEVNLSALLTPAVKRYGS